MAISGGRIGYDCPDGTITWTNEKYDPASGKPVAHPNARFTAPAKQCPVIDKDWENPKGVPISAFLFGGRRPGTLPLVYRLLIGIMGIHGFYSWFLRLQLPQFGLQAGVRRDPFACCHSVATTWATILAIGLKLAKLHQIRQNFQKYSMLIGSEGCQRQVSMAGIWRQHSCIKMDFRKS